MLDRRRQEGHLLRRRRVAGPGFTLIELVIVLVIFAVAATLAVPALQPSLEAARIEAAARRAAAFLDDTRRRSVLDRVTLTVRCRPDEKRLEVRGGSGKDAAFEIPPEVTRLSCTPEQMRYLPQGSAEGMQLILHDARGRGRRVTVGPFTGLTRVEAEP